MTVTKRKPKGLLLPDQDSKPVHGHKKSDNDHIKFCKFFELERCRFGNTSASTLTRKSFLPDLKIDHSQKIYLIIAKTVVAGNLNLTLEINPIKMLF